MHEPENVTLKNCNPEPILFKPRCLELEVAVYRPTLHLCCFLPPLCYMIARVLAVALCLSVCLCLSVSVTGRKCVELRTDLTNRTGFGTVALFDLYNAVL